MPPSGPTRDNHGVRLSERLLLILAPAAVLASVDLLVKDTVPTAAWAYHHRSNAWVAISIVLLLAAVALSLVPSRAVAVAGGVMSAGVLGNLVSARAGGNWVPNPLTIDPGDYTLAFDLADVFFSDRESAAHVGADRRDGSTPRAARHSSGLGACTPPARSLLSRLVSDLVRVGRYHRSPDHITDVRVGPGRTPQGRLSACQWKR